MNTFGERVRPEPVIFIKLESVKLSLAGIRKRIRKENGKYHNDLSSPEQKARAKQNMDRLRIIRNELKILKKELES